MRHFQNNDVNKITKCSKNNNNIFYQKWLCEHYYIYLLFKHNSWSIVSVDLVFIFFYNTIFHCHIYAFTYNESNLSAYNDVECEQSVVRGRGG
jgi:hypothetical protein